MRKIYLTFLFVIMVVCGTLAQTKTLIELSDLDNQYLRTKMSNNATALVSELNRAYQENRVPNLTSIDMTNESRTNVLQIWDCTQYRCIESEIIARCLNTSKGYQIRNMPFIIKDDKSSQDGVINFTPSGTIDAFYFAIESHKYNEIIKANESITDLRRRQMILDFIENFRTAYNRKDIPIIASMYSDDVLIITGNIYKSTGDKMSGLSEEKIKYVKHNKEEYMTRLRRVFAVNKYVNIGFDDIYVTQHPELANVYGVTLRQAWRTTNYSDDGWLFLAIEFHSETEMLIHVRTWQPYMLNGEIFPRNEVFQISEFDF
ncbi:MAG: nuclear transport factor 2 family protein [Rikenellaceae bacterium]